MIKANIREIAMKNGVTTAYQLQKLLDIQPSLAAKWYRNDLEMIGFKTLNSLCAAFNCTPNDILVYVPDNDTPQDSNTESSKTKESNTESSISIAHNTSDRKLNKTSGASESKKGSEALPELPDGDQWLSTKQVAERIGKKPRTVIDLFKSGKLSRIKRGQENFVAESVLKSFIDSQRGI
jgi:DNA-binding Xre family transcriptional regulator